MATKLRKNMTIAWCWKTGLLEFNIAFVERMIVLLSTPLRFVQRLVHLASIHPRDHIPRKCRVSDWRPESGRRLTHPRPVPLIQAHSQSMLQ